MAAAGVTWPRARRCYWAVPYQDLQARGLPAGEIYSAGAGVGTARLRGGQGTLRLVVAMTTDATHCRDSVDRGRSALSWWAAIRCSPPGGRRPSLGDKVAFDVNDNGRVAFGGSMGPEIGQIEGRPAREGHGAVSRRRVRRPVAARR